MYFSPLNGPVSTTGPLIASVIPGQVKSGLSLARKVYQASLAAAKVFGKLNIAASQVSTTVQDLYVLPSRLKVPKINVAFTAISSLDGSVSLNIVVGTGAYETAAAVRASGTYTLTGTPLDTFNNVYTINGIVTTVAQATANSLAQQATADAAAITAATATNGVTAVAAGAVITVTANVSGAAGNSITTVGSSTGGDTVTANQATLSGGASATGITVAGNDNSSTSGLCTNLAVAGNALFNIDVPITVANFPGATTAGGSSGLGLIPTFPDAVYACGAILTLRVITTGTGSVTNLTVSADTEIQPLTPQYIGTSVSPAPTVPFGAVDF
jgi:hypothetical protein